MRALVKVLITSPANIDEELKKCDTLRMYLGWFKRTSDGGFISEADVVKLEGKYKFKDKDSLDLRASLLDWGFNEHEDAGRFFAEHPEGFKWNCIFLCAI